MLGGLNSIEEKAVREFKDTLLDKFGENIMSIKLFGSKARGDYHRESDIDVLVLIKKGDFRVRDRIVDVSSDLLIKYGVLISPRVMTEEHFSYLEYLETAFAKNVIREGVSL
jgi:predicted nucleotidyltransferase